MSVQWQETLQRGKWGEVAVNQRAGLRSEALFCLGLGASSAWWLSMTSSPFVWSSSPLDAGSASLVVHAAYLLVQVVCVLAASRSMLGYTRRQAFALSSGLCSTATIVLLSVLLLNLPAPLIVAARAVASCGGALLFLCWMSPFTVLIGQKKPGSIFLLATVIGTVLWFVTTRVDATVAIVSLVALPLLSGAAALVLPPESREPVRAFRPCARKEKLPLRKLFPLAFIVGLFVYELPMGFVTGSASMAAPDASGGALFQTYGIYTVVMAVVAMADYALARHERYSALLYRFVVPIISVGLILLALARAEDQVFASAMVLAGTILFEMFIMITFARIALSARESPWRIFGFGGAVMEVSLLAAFFCGLFLAKTASTWATAIALGLVFVFILAGSFDVPGKNLLAAGADGGLPESDGDVSRDGRIEAFSRVFGLSAREAEVLGLIARGRSVQAAADELFVAHSTVKTHIGHIYEKAGVSNRQDLLKKLDGFGR